MEFYIKGEFDFGVFKEFQFPTGWNSTPLLLRFPQFLYVSIPNGMEFYPAFWFATSILGQVSIPNGMEFYLRPCCMKPGIEFVSIPNGMEFYF